MVTEHGRTGGGRRVRWRDRLRHRLGRALLGPDVWARLDTLSARHDAQQQQLAEVPATLHSAERAADLQPLLAWMTGAEVHLAALQADHDRLRAHLDERGTDLRPLLDWVRGAEAHLAALQAGHEQLRAVPERHAAQLDRMTARAGALEARIADLEQMDTEIVLTLARPRRTGNLL